MKSDEDKDNKKFKNKLKFYSITIKYYQLELYLTLLD